MINFVEYFGQNSPVFIGLFLLFCFIFGLSILFSGPRPGKNPFSIQHVRPVQPLVTDRNARKQVLKQKFNPNKVPDKLDAIVIGSGIGGLGTAVLLARAGKKVLVLEQHGRAGGCCHTFIEKGFEFDTGIHYIGKMDHGHHERVLLDQLTSGAVGYPKMADVYDVLNLGDPAKPKPYHIVAERPKLEKQLIEYFPKEKSAIKKFLQFVEENESCFFGFFAMKILPKVFVKFLVATGLYKLIFKSYAKYHAKSLKTLLDELTDNDDLKAVLSYCWGDYGVMPSKSSSIMQGAIFNHYGDGAYYINGGSSEIPFRIVQQIEAAGGKVLVKAPVQKILTNEKGHAIGVQVGMKGGEACQMFAKYIISDAGVSNTFLRLLPKEIAIKSSIYPLIQKVGDSCSYISMFVGLEGTAEELGLKAQNIWAFTSSDIEKVTEEYIKLPVEDAAQSEVPLLFISFPSAKDPSWVERFPGKSNLLMITICPYQWFERWENDKVKHRGGDYEGLKNAIGRQMLNQCLHMFPQLENKIEYTNVGTPVSNKYYLGFGKGEIYGLDHTIHRFLPEVSAELRPKTDIPGLYLTGQDISCCGFTGAMFGGMFCAGEILHRTIYKDLDNLVLEVKKQKAKKGVMCNWNNHQN